MRHYRILVLLCLLTTAGCRSPYVEATVSNRTSDALKLIEVDYPSASFGTQTLAPGQNFHYRFKVIGEGKMKLTYTDRANHEHNSDGPDLKEGAEGPLTITISPEGAHWQVSPTVSSSQ